MLEMQERESDKTRCASNTSASGIKYRLDIRASTRNDNATYLGLVHDSWLGTRDSDRAFAACWNITADHTKSPLRPSRLPRQLAEIETIQLTIIVFAGRKDIR